MDTLYNIPSVGRGFDIPFIDILGDIPDPVAVISDRYLVLWANKPVLGHARLSLEEIYGRLCYEVVLGKKRRCPDCPVSTVLDTGEPSSVEKAVPIGDGSIVWKQVKAYPIRDARGKVVAAMRMSFDITRKNRLLQWQARRLEILEKALHGMSQGDLGQSPGDQTTYQCELTGRELEVVRLVARGLTNPEIAGILHISSHTVKTHITHLFNKLEVNHRTEAAMKAARLGLL